MTTSEITENSARSPAGQPIDNPTVCAIVLNWNGYEDTCRCLESLKRATYSELQVVLVDNGSTDGSAERLAIAFPNLDLVRLTGNKGFAGGNNEGIRFAIAQGAEYILVINNDTIVEPNFLNAMIEAAESDPRIGIVTCKAFFASDHQRHYGTGGFFSKIRCSGVPLPRRMRDKECEVSFVSGCIFLVKKQVIEQSGFLDERFFMYFEDLEFSLRVGAHFKLFYTPKAVIYHKSGAGNRWGNYSETYLHYNTRNRLLMFKNYPKWYRAYVFAYSLANSFAKSIAILSYGVVRRNMKDALIRTGALWSGFLTGVLDSSRDSEA